MDTTRSSFRYISSFMEVFSCRFMHDYYSTRVCRDIVIQPTQTSQELIRDYQLKFKPYIGGFSLAVNNAKEFSSIVFTETFELFFEFNFLNPYFYSFTDLNLDPEARYYLADDLSSAVHFGTDFQVDFPALDKPGISGIFSVKHLVTDPILPIAGSEQAKFIPRSKAIILKPRLVKPVYICYTTGEDLEQFEGLTIRNEGAFKGLLSFGPPTQIETHSGLKAFKFISESYLPMRDSWLGYFKLEKKNQLGSYYKTLPNPHPQSIKFDPINKTYISEIYVKL